jgi:simple sugar transport system substrate-binding protein
MSKRISTLLAVLVILTMVLAACGATAEPAKPTAAPAEPTAAPVVEEPAAEEPAAEEPAAEEPAAEEPAVEEPAAAEDPTTKPLKLYAVQHALCAWDSFWCTVEDGLKTAGANMGAEVTILGPDKFDLEKVAQLIEQAVAAKPDGLAVTVTDADLFRAPIQKALDAGIPVVAYNAGNGPVVDDIPYLTYLGQDEYQGGYQAGMRMAADGGAKGVCINQQVGHAGLDKRCNGFVDALTELGIAAEVLAISDDPASSQTVISDYYTANPDADLFLTLGPNGANPFYAFYSQAGLSADQVKHGTFDLSPEINENIKNGVTMFGIDQQPFLQGYGAIEMLVMVNRYGILPALPVTATGPGFITAENVDFEVDAARPVNVYLVQHAMCAWDSFWCVVEAGIKQAAQEMNVEYTLLGPDKFDLEKVAQLIEQAVAAKPDGLAITVTDADLFRAPIEKALDAGIPVVGYNAGNGPVVDQIDYMTYLGQDEYQGGYLGGMRLVADGGTKGVCINQQVGHAGLDRRCNGFVDALTEKGIPAEVLAISDDPASSQTVISDYYTANPDVDVFMTLGPNGANPFYAFYSQAGLSADQVKHGTFDLSPEIIANIKSGVTMFGIDQQPFLQGYDAVTKLALKVRFNISPAMPVTATGPGFVDSSNVEVVEALAGKYR